MADQEVLVVAEVQRIHDPEGMKLYQEGARSQIARFGGIVIGRGATSFEGSPPFERVLVQKWPSAEAFRRWQESDDYRPLRERRQRCADMRIAIVPFVG
jgi:uncharacterized protein (DUF1330 family)